LPITGGQPAPWLAVATALVVAGGMLVLVARSRRRTA